MVCRLREETISLSPPLKTPLVREGEAVCLCPAVYGAHLRRGSVASFPFVLLSSGFVLVVVASVCLLSLPVIYLPAWSKLVVWSFPLLLVALLTSLSFA